MKKTNQPILNYFSTNEVSADVEYNIENIDKHLEYGYCVSTPDYFLLAENHTDDILNIEFFSGKIDKQAIDLFKVFFSKVKYLRFRRIFSNEYITISIRTFEKLIKN